MVCVSWWGLALLLLAVAGLGFALHFAWHWWLLSRPDRPG